MIIFNLFVEGVIVKNMRQQKNTNQWYCRTAPSLGGGFAGDALSAWGTPPYNPDKHINKKVCFFGCYSIVDFYALWKHKGRKAILWAGSDIRHFINGYWLDDKGEIRLAPRPLAEWIIKNCESWVENKAEYDALKKWGIESKIMPSFLGNVDDYQLSFKPSDKPKVYSSVSGDNFGLYGWFEIEQIYAPQNPDIEFHLYGNSVKWETENKNVFIHGRVSQEQMNEETKEMQGALRLIIMEGLSEIIAKSFLWGQYPISAIPYPNAFLFYRIKNLCISL